VTSGTVGGVLKRGQKAEIHGDVKVDESESRQAKADTRQRRAEGLVACDGSLNEAGRTPSPARAALRVRAVLLSLMNGADGEPQGGDRLAADAILRDGVVAVLGWFGLTIALCITVVGSRSRSSRILGGIVALFAGLAATLETTGSALIGHKTKEPVRAPRVSPAGFFLVSGALPFVGAFVKFAVVLVGLGSVASTRGAGLFSCEKQAFGSPYRDVSPAL